MSRAPPSEPSARVALLAAGEVVSARRRLIRGVALAPAIMTVCSGSAFANASNLRCFRNANASPVLPVPGVITGTDGFVRVALHQVTNPDFSISYFVRGIDFGAIESDWRQFDIVTNTVGSIVPSISPVLSNKYAVVRFDGAGQPVGVGAGTGGSAIGASCWASLHPGP